MSHLCPRGAEVTCCGWHRPARWLCARQCVRGFQIPKSLQPGFAGSQWDAAPGEDLLDGTLHPKTLGCCLGAATTLRSPCKGGSSSQPGAGQEHPRAPPPPRAWLTAGQPGGRLLSHCWLQPQHSPAGSTAGTCPQPLPAAGFAVLGGTYRPTTGEGTQLPLGLSCPQPVQIPERQCFVPSPPPRVVPSVPGPLVAGGKGRLVQPGVTVVRLSLPGVPCRCLRCIQGTTTGGEVEGQRRYKGNNGLRALVKLWVR